MADTIPLIMEELLRYLEGHENRDKILQHLNSTPEGELKDGLIRFLLIDLKITAYKKNSAQFVGMDYKELSDQFQKEGFCLRSVNIDGVSQAITFESRGDRLNVWTYNGKITHIDSWS